MNFHNFLTSGISFNESEENLAFRFRFLNAVMLTAVVSTSIFALLDQFGLNSLGSIQLFFTELYALASIALIGYLRGRKHAYNVCAWSVIISAYALFSSALIHVPNDELRIIWYYILVVVAYVSQGNKAGIIVTAASIIAVAVAKFNMGIVISDNAFATFVLSLAVASGITYSYTNLANSYFERMLRNVLQLRDLASKDPLTGLWNSRFFADASNNLFEISQRNNEPLCILFIDIDHFKSINDTYGHQTGDIVLREVAHCLSGHLRKSDLLSRIGGEEFVVLMCNTDIYGAHTIAEKLRSGTESLRNLIPSAPDRHITISIGIAQNVPSDDSIIDTQKRADLAMYEAKLRGRNRVVIGENEGVSHRFIEPIPELAPL